MAARQRTRLLLIALAIATPLAEASDACSGRAIIASADVSVSDGSAFRTEALFHSREAAAIRHIREPDQLVTVEGPRSWYRVGGRTGYGEAFHKVFALGHQYHAFLLHFDELADDIRPTQIEFGGEERAALAGNYPYGGLVQMVTGDAPGRPAGMRFEFEGTPPIDVSFGDWLEHSGQVLPFLAIVDDGERRFEYRYDRVVIEDRSPLWFFEATGATGLDETELYRLHRTLLAAHCMGDADLMADKSVDGVVSANRGSLATISKAAMAERFTAVFEAVDYREYHDLKTPVVEVAESGDLGWLAVEVRAVGTDRSTGDAFDSQWAWLMTARKVDSQWKHAGNASSRADD